MVRLMSFEMTGWDFVPKPNRLRRLLLVMYPLSLT